MGTPGATKLVIPLCEATRTDWGQGHHNRPPGPDFCRVLLDLGLASRLVAQGDKSDLGWTWFSAGGGGALEQIFVVPPLPLSPRVPLMCFSGNMSSKLTKNNAVILCSFCL